jgi:hypothetical protein
VLMASFAFFGLLWLLDFPKPMIDDLFYTGAATHLAQGGDFSNPYLVNYFPGQHFYFCYPPVHSYALAGWLKIFGVNAAAMTAFQVLMYFLMTAAVVAILHQNEAPAWLGFLVPLIAADAFIGYGLRTEPLAVALSWTGFAIIECGARRAPAVFLALFLMFLAGATAPRIVFFDVGLISVVGWRLWESPGSEKRSLWQFIIAAVAALGLAVFIFLLMIHFRVAEFWAEFHEHSQMVKINNGVHMGPMQLVLIFVGAIMAIFAWRYRSDRLIQICIALGAAFCLAFPTRTIGGGLGSWNALLLILFLSATVIKKAPRAVGVVLPLALGALLVWRDLPTIAEAYGILSGHIEADRGNQYETARTLTSTPEHQIFLDSAVARYCFDYRTPEGSIDFPFSEPFPMVGAVMPQLIAREKPQDIYLLSPRYRDYAERSTYLEKQPRERWTMFGSSFDKFPCKVFIIRAAECKGLKSSGEKP